MMIECPACATRYEVPDNAIGPGGRNVRCAKCDHRWQEYGNNAPPLEQAEAFEPIREEVRVDSPPREEQGPASSAASNEDAPVAAVQEPDRTLGVGDVEREQEDGAPSRQPGQPLGKRAPRRRRGTARLLVWAAIIVLVVAAAAFTSVRLLGMPDWVPGDRSSFASGEPDLKLNFPDDQLGMRQLPDGTEIFGARGTITNVGSSERVVPPILIVLRDAHDRIVYSWEVTPAKRRLGPGESIAVNEAVTDVPRSARVADIGWKPG